MAISDSSCCGKAYRDRHKNTVFEFRETLPMHQKELHHTLSKAMIAWSLAALLTGHAILLQPQRIFEIEQFPEPCQVLVINHPDKSRKFRFLKQDEEGPDL
ncbi:MAG: hypothetical protein AAF959_18595 [Cyanobacteria bacterium P01_D01_bin.56]